MCPLSQPSTRRVDPILRQEERNGRFLRVDPCSRQQLYRRGTVRTSPCGDLNFVTLSCGMPHFLKQSTWRVYTQIYVTAYFALFSSGTFT